MRYDANKAYPHPVLRPESTDYPHAEFQVELTIERIETETAVRVTAEFELSEPDLLRLVEHGDAEYVLLVRSAATHHRSCHRSPDPRIVEEFANGRLSGTTEVRGLLVASRDLLAFQAQGWHADYAGETFEVGAGDVLAEDEPKECTIDTAEEAPINSIVVIRRDEALTDGEWQCDFGGDLVEVRMSVRDYQRFMDARERYSGTPELAYIMNAVYLPALVYVLQRADAEAEDGELDDRRWYRSLDRRLDACNRPALGSGEDRLSDAQALLEQPFAMLPLLEEGQG